MGTVDGPLLPLHTAGSFSHAPFLAVRLVCAVNDRRGKPNKPPTSIPTDEAWLTTTQALELIRTNFRCSEGRAENLRREAIASGDVRLQDVILIITDWGERVWCSNRITPAQAASRMEHRSDAFSFADELSLRINGPDLRAWILAQAPAPLSSRRYAGDDDLVIQGVSGIKAGTWPNPLRAAQELARLAQGASERSTVDRLRKKIGEALED